MNKTRNAQTSKHSVDKATPSSPAFGERMGPTATLPSDFLNQVSGVGFSLCPSTINCQLSLLCLERAREIESDILNRLDRLLLSSNPAKNSLETLFIVYTTLTLLMDAYESWAISFQVRIISGASMTLN
jgi:hypothetical protein